MPLLYRANLRGPESNRHLLVMVRSIPRSHCLKTADENGSGLAQCQPGLRRKVTEVDPVFGPTHNAEHGEHGGANCLRLPLREPISFPKSPLQAQRTCSGWGVPVRLSCLCRVGGDEVTPISLPQMGFEEKYRPEYFCRLQRSNSNLTTSKVSKMVPEHGSAPWSPDSKSGILLARRLGN